MDNVDAYAIATNGLIASDPFIIILDPLGYYVIRVDERIKIIGTGPVVGKRKPAKRLEEKKKKVITITVSSPENQLYYHKEVVLDDVDLTIKTVELIEKELYITIHDPKLDDSDKTMNFKVIE